MRERRQAVVADAIGDLGDGVAARRQEQERLFEAASAKIGRRGQRRRPAKSSQERALTRVAGLRELAHRQQLEEMRVDEALGALHERVTARGPEGRLSLGSIGVGPVDLANDLQLEEAGTILRSRPRTKLGRVSPTELLEPRRHRRRPEGAQRRLQRSGLELRFAGGPRQRGPRDAKEEQLHRARMREQPELVAPWDDGKTRRVEQELSICRSDAHDTRSQRDQDQGQRVTADDGLRTDDLDARLEEARAPRRIESKWR